MKNYKNVLLFIMLIFIFPIEIGNIKKEPIHPSIRIEQESVFSISLPDWATTCDITPVYSKPDGKTPIYYIDGMEPVRIRYGSKDNNYAAIGVSEWVKTTDLCSVP